MARKIISNSLVIMPFTNPWNWSADYQRQTCLRLAKHSNTIVAYMNQHAHFILRPTKQTYPQVKNIIFFTPKYFIPFRRFKFIERLNQAICLSWIRIKYHSLNKSFLWVFDPHFHYLLKLAPGTIRIYDCVDFVSNINYTKNSKLRSQEKNLIQEADYFFVNSRTLAQIHSKLRRPDKIAPQGFRLSDFTNLLPTQINFKKKHPSKPVIGFIGGLNYRLDFELLLPLIKNNPRWHFVFWGPKQQTSQDKQLKTQDNLSRILIQKNVTSGMSAKRRQIPHIISQFDICIIPYDTSQPINKYCYPMKLFEYFYLGKPVISTPIQELRRFPNLIALSNTSTGWSNHITRLISNPWPASNKNIQKKLAIQHSWKNKLGTISSLINNH